MSEKITQIFPENVEALEKNEDGNYRVPDGYIIYRVPTVAEKRDNVQGEIDRIEALKEPTDKELIEFAKSEMVYYYEINEMLPFYKRELEVYKKLLKEG